MNVRTSTLLSMIKMRQWGLLMGMMILRQWQKANFQLAVKFTLLLWSIG